MLTVEQDVTELLRGHRGQGEWHLRVTDRRQGTVGYLMDFTLSLTPNVLPVSDKIAAVRCLAKLVPLLVIILCCVV